LEHLIEVLRERWIVAVAALFLAARQASGWRRRARGPAHP
jgi:hypothetical protein